MFPAWRNTIDTLGLSETCTVRQQQDIKPSFSKADEITKPHLGLCTINPFFKSHLFWDYQAIKILGWLNTMNTIVLSGLCTLRQQQDSQKQTDNQTFFLACVPSTHFHFSYTTQALGLPGNIVYSVADPYFTWDIWNVYSEATVAYQSLILKNRRNNQTLFRPVCHQPIF